MNRRTVAWIALAAVVVITLAIVAWPSGGKPSDAARVQSVSSELRCPDCESQSIAQSSTETARAARADIRRRVDTGQSDGEISQASCGAFRPPRSCSAPAASCSRCGAGAGNHICTRPMPTASWCNASDHE